MLENHPLPGNVRQLRHVMERGCVICNGTTLLSEHLPAEIFSESQGGDAEVKPAKQQSGDSKINLSAQQGGLVSERERLFLALESAGGNKAKAARLLGIDRSTLYRKLKKYAFADGQ